MIKKCVTAGAITLVLCVLSLSSRAQTINYVTESKKPNHVITVYGMQSGTDSVLIQRTLHKFSDRIEGLRIDMAQRTVSMHSDLATKDLMEILLAAGFTSFYISGEGKKIVMTSTGQVETWNVK